MTREEEDAVLAQAREIERASYEVKSEDQPSANGATTRPAAAACA